MPMFDHQPRRGDPPECAGVSNQKKEMLDSLRKETGPRFDQEYLSEMVSAHEKTVKLLETEISGGSGDTKELAQELLPTVKSHLREAYRLNKERYLATLGTAGMQCAWLFVYQGRGTITLAETELKITRSLDRWLKEHG